MGSRLPDHSLMQPAAPTMAVRRVAFIAHSAASLVRFRGALMRAALARRHRVLALAPDMTGPVADALEADGIVTGSFPLEAEGAGPFAARRTRNGLAGHLADFAPQVVVASGPRTAALGALAGRAAGADRVVLIVNGLSALGGSETSGWGSGAGRRRRDALAASDVVVFHNDEDRRALLAEGVLSAARPYVVTPGSGVDIARYAVAPLPPVADGLEFLLLARLDKAMGTETFAAAVAQVKAKAPVARFVIVGPDTPATGGAGGALTARHLARFGDAVIYRGPADDVRPHIAAAHVVVHPSVSEGLPGALLEALAMGRPVIASDIPGSRQVVDERVNGCLVPPGDASALAEAIESYLKRPDLIPAMARAARSKAERLFDERAVVATMLETLGLA